VNVCTPVECFPDRLSYVDLHVDVVQQPNGTLECLDEEELETATAAGHLSEALATKARSVAAAVESGLAGE
jgi:predicted RNA-binding protein associated with RNAse of E/G family